MKSARLAALLLFLLTLTSIFGALNAKTPSGGGETPARASSRRLDVKSVNPGVVYFHVPRTSPARNALMSPLPAQPPVIVGPPPPPMLPPPPAAITIQVYDDDDDEVGIDDCFRACISFLLIPCSRRT